MKTTSTNINAYKKEIMDRLEINEEIYNKTFKSTLYSFKKEMENLGQNFISSLMMLEYDKLITYDKNDKTVSDIVEYNNIYNKNVKKDNECFMCLCGKQHLKNLHLFNHENCDNTIIIGSSCIEQVGSLKEAYKENRELYEHLTKINNRMKFNEKKKQDKLTKKECYKCKLFLIKKDYNYSNPHHNNYCKNCVNKYGKIVCSQCNLNRIDASIPMKYNKNEFKKICKGCWIENNKGKAWFGKK